MVYVVGHVVSVVGFVYVVGVCDGFGVYVIGVVLSVDNDSVVYVVVGDVVSVESFVEYFVSVVGFVMSVVGGVVVRVVGLGVYVVDVDARLVAVSDVAVDDAVVSDSAVVEIEATV